MGESRRGNAGKGRKKGSKNKATASIKQAFLDAFENRGGVDALTTWAESNETEFYKLAARLIPTDVSVAATVTLEHILAAASAK